MEKLYTWIGRNISDILAGILIVCIVIVAFINSAERPVTKKEPEPLKEFKDGVQNHLVWDIKNKCYFVRPNDDVTVYLIHIPDCDKK